MSVATSCSLRSDWKNILLFVCLQVYENCVPLNVFWIHIFSQLYFGSMSKQKQTLIKCKQAIDNSQNVFGKKKMHQADTDNFIEISGFISSQSNYKAEIFRHVWSEKEYSLIIALCFALFFFFLMLHEVFSQKLAVTV